MGRFWDQCWWFAENDRYPRVLGGRQGGAPFGLPVRGANQRTGKRSLRDGRLPCVRWECIASPCQRPTWVSCSSMGSSWRRSRWRRCWTTLVEIYQTKLHQIVASKERDQAHHQPAWCGCSAAIYNDELLYFDHVHREQGPDCRARDDWRPLRPGDWGACLVWTQGRWRWSSATRGVERGRGSRDFAHHDLSEENLYTVHEAEEAGRAVAWLWQTIRESQHGHSSVSLSTWKVSDHRRGFEEAHEVQSMPWEGSLETREPQEEGPDGDFFGYSLSREQQVRQQRGGLLLWPTGKPYQLNSSQWEAQLAAIPYIAVTDSRSLYDCMNKLVCSYTQTEDKRTAIDIAILKDDLKKSGGHARWVAGNNMVADALTKRMRGDFLRAVCNKGKWTLTHHGNQLLRSDFEILLAFAVA